MPVALTIAGSDPSGGAGIQSDLRTFAALGVNGISVITALTVQNSRGVHSVHPVAPDILAAQLNAILEDTRPDAVKIGMLGGAKQVRVVAEALRRFRPPNVILDPILASTGGVPLLDEEGRHLLLTELMPLSDLITPNVPELGLLTGMETDYKIRRDNAVRTLQQQGAKIVLVKGGHLRRGNTDSLYLLDGTSRSYHSARQDTQHTHGTGCLLSSAIAAGLANGSELHEATSAAKEIVTRALQSPVIVGQGRGYPDVSVGVREQEPFCRAHSERLAGLRGVYVVTDTTLRPHRSTEDIAYAAMDGGASTLQLRDKSSPLQNLSVLAQKLRSVTSNMSRHGQTMLFIINDRVDVALASYADGVHLGPDDLHAADARRLLGPNKLVGVSTGTLAEAIVAAPYASYFGVGAIFGTKTKSDAGAPVGVERIREIKTAFPHIPLVAIGGINRDNIAEVARAGADAAAVVSAVVAAPDMAEATRELVRLFNAAKP